jgi:hypothetical protein
MKDEGKLIISGAFSAGQWIQWHYKPIMGGTMMAAVKRIPTSGSIHMKNGIWYPLYTQNCAWPEHIEQMCELKEKCPIKKGMPAAEEVQLCPMYGSDKNVNKGTGNNKTK